MSKPLSVISLCSLFCIKFLLSASIFSLSFVVWLNWLLRMSDHMFFSCLDRKTSHRWSWSSCRPLWTKWASLKILGCSAPNLLKLMWDPMAVTVVCIVLIVNVVLSPEVTRLHYYLSNGCHCCVHCLNRYVIRAANPYAFSVIDYTRLVCITLLCSHWNHYTQTIKPPTKKYSAFAFLIKVTNRFAWFIFHI